MAKANLKGFDYLKVARLDTNLWRTYAGGNRSPLPLFFQAFVLIKYQLGFSWGATAKLAYCAVWAAAGYRLRKNGKENYLLAEKYLTKLFETVSKNSRQPFNFSKAAKLELEWWDIQRYPDKYQKTLSQSLNENMATVYGVSANQVVGYGQNRAKVLLLVNESKKPLDWAEMERQLSAAWKSLHTSVNSK